MWLHLDDEVLALAVTAVAVALLDPARRVDLPEAAQADAAPDAPLNAPEDIQSFEDNAAQEKQLPQACPTAQSRNLVPISLENPVRNTVLQ